MFFKIAHYVSNLSLIVPVIFLLLCVVAISLAWYKPDKEQGLRLKSLIIVVVFFSLDWFFIALLPKVGLSFGPVGLALLGITFVRTFIAFVLIIGWQIVVKVLLRIQSQRVMITGVLVMLIINLIILGCELWGMYIEPFNLKVTELTLDAPDFLKDRPLRIVHLSDIHVERTTKREKALIKKVNTLKPDMIVLTGDYLNISYTYDKTAHQHARELLSKLTAPYGVYAVVSLTVDRPDIIPILFDDMDNITLMQDEIITIPFENAPMHLIGISNRKFMRNEEEEVVLDKLMQQVPDDAYTFLLYHTPDLIEYAAKKNIDLYMGGHTHGGQICAPFYGAILTASKFGKKYASGHYTVNNTTLYISRGIGMEGKGAPRARFLAPPEIVVVNLE